jgi:LacI family transcriptional regulator
MRAKATDVAALAGVSVATVSLVVNGKGLGRVSAGTQRRVQAAITELGYVVNPAARSLVTGRHGRIVLLTHDLGNPFIASTASGVSSVLERDMQLILAAGGTEQEPPDVATIASFGIDGMLINLDGTEYEPFGPGPTLPVVVLDEPEDRDGLSRVFFDVTIGAAQLAEHLAQLGHRTVVYLDSTRSRTSFEHRRRRFTHTFGQTVTGSRVIRAKCDIELDAGRQITVRNLTGWSDRGVTAVVAATDVQAYGVLAGLAERGRDVGGFVRQQRDVGGDQPAVDGRRPVRTRPGAGSGVDADR